MHICMLAAENDSLPGGKVGGIGDVLRDLPAAIAATGVNVTVIVPAYGAFHQLPGAERVATVSALFSGREEHIDVYNLATGSSSGVQQVALEHPLFSSCGTGNIYCNDGADRPFATDASKFALFSTAALSAIASDTFGSVDVIHMHDWHSAFAAILAFYNPQYESLKYTPRVFSIHNLAMQGIRPLSGDESSWQTWFPDVRAPDESIADPRWPNCVNPMAAAIRLSTRVHTVSPTYADEIQQANDASRGFHGGEGLEKDIQAAAREQRLVGILNGTEYDVLNVYETPAPAAKPKPKQSFLSRSKAPAIPPTRSKRDDRWALELKKIRDTSLKWLGETDPMLAVHYLAHQRTLQWIEKADTPKHIVTSVGRLTDQKMAIALHVMEDGRTALDQMLKRLAEDNGVFIFLGSGDSELEARCQAVSAAHDNCLFLNRYDTNIADALFEFGDLFFMPSSFEPCGISQLVSMKHGQPCLVHAVGGLKDTIVDGVDGFQFTGSSPEEQALNCVARFDEAITLHTNNALGWQEISKVAASRRFTWAASAEQYREHLYRDAK